MKFMLLNFRRLILPAILFISFFNASAQTKMVSESIVLTQKIAAALKTSLGNSIIVKDSSIEYKTEKSTFLITIFNSKKGKEGMWKTVIINNCEVDFRAAGSKEIDKLVYQAIFKEKLGSAAKVIMADDKNGSYYPEIKFKGIIEQCNMGCAVDGICTLTVSGIEIKWASGEYGGTEPRGKVLNAEEVQLSNSIGKSAEVYCRFIPYLSEIYGKADYYIKLLN